MTEVAGEVADGFLVHPFSTARVPAASTRCPRSSAGSPRAGRDARRHRDRVAGDGRHRRRPTRTRPRPQRGDRAQLAFYGSTPAYKVVLDAHGWGDLQPGAQPAVEGRATGTSMASLIDDEMLDTFAVVGAPDEIAPMIAGALRRARRPRRVQRAVPLGSRRVDRGAAGFRARRMTTLRIGTADGLIEPPHGVTVDGPTRVFGDAALVRRRPHAVAPRRQAGPSSASAPDLLCAVDAPGGLLIGTEGAHLARVSPTGLERDRELRGRAPVATLVHARGAARRRPGRSPCTDDNVLFASIHVGGIPRSDDGGRTWHADDRHRGRRPPGPRAAGPGGGRASPPRPSGSAARTTAGAPGRCSAEGLHASYCRAVAVTGDAVLVSASEGPRGRTARAVPPRTGRRPGRSSASPTGSRATSTPTRSTRVDDQVVYGTRTGDGVAVDRRRHHLGPARRRPRPRHQPQPRPLTCVRAGLPSRSFRQRAVGARSRGARTRARPSCCRRARSGRVTGRVAVSSVASWSTSTSAAV